MARVTGERGGVGIYTGPMPGRPHLPGRARAVTVGRPAGPSTARTSCRAGTGTPPAVPGRARAVPRRAGPRAARRAARNGHVYLQAVVAASVDLLQPAVGVPPVSSVFRGVSFSSHNAVRCAGGARSDACLNLHARCRALFLSFLFFYFLSSPPNSAGLTPLTQ